jgi:hypothetical protein
MTATHLLHPAPGSAQPVRRAVPQDLPRKMPATIGGLAGATLVVYGVRLPWLSTFEGLIKQSGWGSHNGNILVASGLLVALFSVLQMFVATTPMRWLLALAGFATAGYAGYLLVQLYAVTQQSDGMTFIERGPGLYVAAAGGALAFATIFLPMPRRSEAGPDLDMPSDRAGSVGSRLRFPAAALAVAAGLAHVPVTPEHLREAPYIGVLFIMLTVACVVLAALLVTWDHALVWLALGGACLLAVIAYVVSRTMGLPLMADDIGNWWETLGVVSVLTESAVVVLAATVLSTRLSHRTTTA